MEVGFFNRGLASVPWGPLRKASMQIFQRVQVPLYYLHGSQSHDSGTPLRPNYMPYTFMDPLGLF